MPGLLELLGPDSALPSLGKEGYQREGGRMDGNKEGEYDQV